MAGTDRGWPSSVSPDLRELAERVLTAKQLEVIKLVAWGYGDRRIASILGLGRDAVRDRRQRAELKLFMALGGEVFLG